MAKAKIAEMTPKTCRLECRVSHSFRVGLVTPGPLRNRLDEFQSLFLDSCLSSRRCVAIWIRAPLPSSLREQDHLGFLEVYL